MGLRTNRFMRGILNGLSVGEKIVNNSFVTCGELVCHLYFEWPQKRLGYWHARYGTRSRVRGYHNT